MQGERSSRKRQCGEEEEARRKGQLSGQESEREEKIKGKSRQRQSWVKGGRSGSRPTTKWHCSCGWGPSCHPSGATSLYWQFFLQCLLYCLTLWSAERSGAITRRAQPRCRLSGPCSPLTSTTPTTPSARWVAAPEQNTPHTIHCGPRRGVSHPGSSYRYITQRIQRIGTFVSPEVARKSFKTN